MVDLAGSERQAKTGAKVWIKVFVKRGNVYKNGNDKIKFKMKSNVFSPITNKIMLFMISITYSFAIKLYLVKIYAAINNGRNNTSAIFTVEIKVKTI